jgi:hypothetical protein
VTDQPTPTAWTRTPDLACPLQYLVDPVTQTTRLDYGPALPWSGRYLLRGGIAPPSLSVDGAHLLDGAIVVAGYSILDGVTRLLWESAWTRPTDLVIAGAVACSGAWRDLARCWSLFGVSSYSWAAAGPDMAPHKTLLREPGLAFGVAFPLADYDVTTETARVLSDIRAGAVQYVEGGPFHRTLPTVRLGLTPPPAVLGALTALNRLDRAARHYQTDRGDL